MRRRLGRRGRGAAEGDPGGGAGHLRGQPRAVCPGRGRRLRRRRVRLLGGPGGAERDGEEEAGHVPRPGQRLRHCRQVARALGLPPAEGAGGAGPAEEHFERRAAEGLGPVDGRLAQAASTRLAAAHAGLPGRGGPAASRPRGRSRHAPAEAAARRQLHGERHHPRSHSLHADAPAALRVHGPGRQPATIRSRGVLSVTPKQPPSCRRLALRPVRPRGLPPRALALVRHEALRPAEGRRAGRELRAPPPRQGRPRGRARRADGPHRCRRRALQQAPGRRPGEGRRDPPGLVRAERPHMPVLHEPLLGGQADGVHGLRQPGAGPPDGLPSDAAAGRRPARGGLR
mmetsp:Transcript_67711/g.201370  ORF Transcript_67711/g.201370 Transcript_67711/m.201370 type:complete len:343 (-) Transcript_67711:825-1853(-)